MAKSLKPIKSIILIPELKPELKKMPELQKVSTKAKISTKPPDIEICLENFEILAKKYKPLIISNIKKVQKIYSNYSPSEYDDLYQEGLIALYQSIINFDKTKGVFFGVYLKVAISNSLRYYFRNHLPHKYSKNVAKSIEKNKPQFDRIAIVVDTLDDHKSYLL